MEKGLKLLRRMYPDREDFTDAEVEMVELALQVNAESGVRSGMLPSKFVEVGETVTVGGYVYRCVEARRMACPADACLGCDFSRLYRNCSSVQCGCFDRRDRKFVWFKEVCDAE